METQPSVIPDLFEHGLETGSNPILLNHRIPGDKWHSIGAGEAAARIRAIALGFHALGVRPGDRIALLSENRPEWTLVDLGALSIGAVIVPIYTTQLSDQIAFIFSNSEPKWVVVSNRALYERALPALEQCKLTDLLVTFQTMPPVPHSIPLDLLEESGRKLDGENPALFGELRSRLTPETLASIIYTYDPTGVTKGVMLTHGNFVSNVLACASLFPIRREDTALSYLPLSHVFERMIVFHYLYRGVSVYYAESVEHVADSVVKVRPTVMTTVPRLLEKVEERMIASARKLPVLGKMAFGWCMKIAHRFDPEKSPSLIDRIAGKFADLFVYGRLRKRFGGRLSRLISGGARLKPELGKLFTAAGITVYQGYGLTETSPVITTNYPGKNRLGSVGRVIPGVTVKIADDGEILVLGPNVMKGYYRNEEATRKAFEDGWFKTGDIGVMDRDGFLFVTDRKKDLMKTSGGKYVAPQAIEQALGTSDYVEKAVIVADGRKFVSALIFASLKRLKQFAEQNGLQDWSYEALLGHPGVKEVFDQLVTKVNQRLSPWETVKKFAVLAETVSLTGEEARLAPRQQRKSVEKRYREVVEAFYREAGGRSSRVSDAD